MTKKNKKKYISINLIKLYLYPNMFPSTYYFNKWTIEKNVVVKFTSSYHHYYDNNDINNILNKTIFIYIIYKNNLSQISQI